MSSPVIHVLIADDEKSIRDGCERSLEGIGCRTVKVENGELCIAAVEREDFDLVLLDLLMPGISGFEVLNWLHENRPDLKVIVITGFASIRNAVGTIKQGAFDFLPKPFSPRELRAAVEKAMSKTGAGPGNSLDK